MANHDDEQLTPVQTQWELRSLSDRVKKLEASIEGTDYKPSLERRIMDAMSEAIRQERTERHEQHRQNLLLMRWAITLLVSIAGLVIAVLVKK